jgi:aerobic-type carbon monoxide dehydrogenase small subunit (CoxS/CutS family)
MILAAKALLLENSNPSEEEILAGLGGNLCRCTGYVKIIDAVLAARDNMKEEDSSEQK